MDNRITEVLRARALHIGRWLCSLFEGVGDSRFYVAGGSMTGDRIADVDLFPMEVGGLDCIVREDRVLARTPNAITLKHDQWPVQICKYVKPSLEHLVRSFDFAHIQVGARLSVKNGHVLVEEVFVTDEFVVARASNTTWFCGTDYPLSSLIRAGKYFKNGSMHRGTYIRCVIDALIATVERGFEDYEDFKDQLDAVDLGLLPEQLKEVEKAGLKELFSLLCKKDVQKQGNGG